MYITSEDIRLRANTAFKESYHVTFSENAISSGYNQIIEGKYNLRLAEEVIRGIPSYDNTDFAFRQILEVFEKVCENESPSTILSLGRFISEAAVQKTRTGSQTKDYLKMKVRRFKTKLHTKFNTNISGAKSAASDAIEAMQKNLGTNLSNVKSNINKGLNKQDEQKVTEACDKAYSDILESYLRVEACDRIISNYNKINSKSNLDGIIKENCYDTMQGVVEICSVIDRYKMSDNIKINAALECSMYGLYKNRIRCKRKDILSTVVEYFMLSISPLTEDKKSVVEKVAFSNSLFTDADKGDLESTFKDIAKLDIKFDDSTILLQEKPDMSKYMSMEEIAKVIFEDAKSSETVQDIIDAFKKETEKTPDRLKALVTKIYTKSPEQIIEGLPNFLGWIRVFFVVGGATAINPVLGAVALVADLGLKIKLSRKQLAKYIADYEKEIKKTKDKIESTSKPEVKENLQAYLKQLEKSLDKLKDHDDKLYSDDENTNRHTTDASDIDDSDDLFDFNFDEAVNLVTTIEKLTEKAADMDIAKLTATTLGYISDEDLSDLTGLMTVYPDMPFDRASLVGALDAQLEEYNGYQSNPVKANKKRAIKEAISNLSKGEVVIGGYGNARDYIARTTVYLEACEVAKNLIYESMSLHEMDISNTLKMAKENLKKTVKGLSDKEKNLSRSIDVSFDQVSKSAERAMMNDNREAVIRGSLIPSASKIIKNAIVTGAAWAVSPAVAVIGVIGHVAISKKLQAKERQLILDDIEIEIDMCERYMKIAEDNNDLKAQRNLLITKRNLERQRQRIKYKMTVYFNQKVDLKKNNNDDDY